MLNFVQNIFYNQLYFFPIFLALSEFHDKKMFFLRNNQFIVQFFYFFICFELLVSKAVLHRLR